MSKISHHFWNTNITEEHLHKALWKIFNISHSVTVQTFFQQKINGGLEVRKPSSGHAESQRRKYKICG